MERVFYVVNVVEVTNSQVQKLTLLVKAYLLARATRFAAKEFSA